MTPPIIAAGIIEKYIHRFSFPTPPLRMDMDNFIKDNIMPVVKPQMYPLTFENLRNKNAQNIVHNVKFVIKIVFKIPSSK